ncbi:MAG: hypothetical protein D6785_11165 [Planctomycetota bacterium]|nr:MAG: hypothetical protein D6785_11165 [Planctomycetota bacterium]
MIKKMIKVKDEKDQINIAKVYESRQEHIFRWWDELEGKEKRTLLDQLNQIDFQLLNQLAKKHIVSGVDTKKISLLSPPSVIPYPAITEEQKKREQEALKLGEHILESKKVAFFMSAGELAPGQEIPLGLLPIGPVSQKTLYEWHGEKIAALSEKYRTGFPWIIMVSDHTEKETKTFFEKQSYFGLSRAEIRFVKQKMLPLLNKRGKIILKNRSTLCFSTNGYGGAIGALQSTEILEELVGRGMEYLFYFQVENPLVKIGDPLFLGYHVLEEAEVSTKVVPKKSVEEKVDIASFVDGSLGIVNFEEVPEKEKHARTSEGNLTFFAGNASIHIFTISFLLQLFEEGFQLPYHKVQSTTPNLSGKGEDSDIKDIQAIQFETSIFDILYKAKKKILVQASREEEFAPIMEEHGPFSLEKSREALLKMFALWFSQVGEEELCHLHDCLFEVTPKYALDFETFRSKLAVK